VSELDSIYVPFEGIQNPLLHMRSQIDNIKIFSAERVSPTSTMVDNKINQQYENTDINSNNQSNNLASQLKKLGDSLDVSIKNIMDPITIVQNLKDRSVKRVTTLSNAGKKEENDMETKSNDDSSDIDSSSAPSVSLSDDDEEYNDKMSDVEEEPIYVAKKKKKKTKVKRPRKNLYMNQILAKSNYQPSPF
jgi:hypothetical protein